MHYIYYFTPDEIKKAMEAQKEIFDKSMKEYHEKHKKVEEWHRRHPPCPHCSHQEQLPIWLQY